MAVFCTLAPCGRRTTILLYLSHNKWGNFLSFVDDHNYWLQLINTYVSSPKITSIFEAEEKVKAIKKQKSCHLSPNKCTHIDLTNLKENH